MFKCLEKGCRTPNYKKQFWADRHAEMTGHKVVERNYGAADRALQEAPAEDDEAVDEVATISGGIGNVKKELIDLANRVKVAIELLEKIENRL